jgi:hypothetical protein
MAAVNLRAWSRWLALLGIASGSAAATDVDLAKTGPGRAEAFPWQGRTLSQVLPVDAIDRIVLLKAVTSAPADLDVRNLRGMLRDAASAPLQAANDDERAFLQLGGNDTLWEAVLLTRAGAVFGLVIRPDADAAGQGAHRACLTDEAGRRGCFGIPAVPVG